MPARLLLPTLLLLPLFLRGQDGAVKITLPKVRNLSVTLTPLSKAEFEKKRSIQIQNRTSDPPLLSLPLEGRMCITAIGNFQVISCIEEIEDRIGKVKRRYIFEIPSRNIALSVEDSENKEHQSFSVWKLQGYLPTQYMSLPVFTLDGAWCYSESYKADYFYFNNDKYISVEVGSPRYIGSFFPHYFVKGGVLVVVEGNRLWVIDLNKVPISYAVLENPWYRLLGIEDLMIYEVEVYALPGEEKACVLAFRKGGSSSPDEMEEFHKYLLLRWQ